MSPSSRLQITQSRPDTDLVIKLANDRLEGHSHFGRHGDSIQLMVVGKHLVVTGRVPSFYLKQVLQAALSGLPGIERVENHVGVVSCCGLSSVPQRPPTEPAGREIVPAGRPVSLHPRAAKGESK
ncbi:MAG: BON domain-containing protein [Planctomycetota bacterium]